MIKVVLVLLGLMAMAYCQLEGDMDFNSFKAKLGKNYSRSEENVRMAEFNKTRALLRKINGDSRSTYKLELNYMADMTDDERAQRLGLSVSYAPAKSLQKGVTNGVKGVTNRVKAVTNRVRGVTNGAKGRNGSAKAATRVLSAPPTSLDWRSSNGKNYLPPIRDQGGCGSCYAFAAIGALESRNYIQNGGTPWPDYSEQEIVDCSSGYGNYGCNGGWITTVYNYIKAKNGINTEATYPYKASTQTCKASTADLNAKITGYTETVRTTSTDSHVIAALQTGPVVFAFYVQSDFFSYKSGIYAPSSCPGTVNHAMMIVGYTPEYWIVRNSWGIGWGESGYVKISRTPVNLCNMLQYPIWYPNLASNSDWKQTVVFMKYVSRVGQDLFLRGGVSHTRRSNCTVFPSQCVIPLDYSRVSKIGGPGYIGYETWSQGDTYLDWAGKESTQPSMNGKPAEGSPMVWTTNVQGSPSYSSFNNYGEHYWMLNVWMDCRATENGWFELKGFLNGAWENDINQNNYCSSNTGLSSTPKPYSSNNHMARCGYRNIFQWNKPSCRIDSV